MTSPLSSAVSVHYHEVEQHHSEVLSGSRRCGPCKPTTSSTKAPQLQLHGVHGSVSRSGSSLANGSGIQKRCGHNLLVNNCGRGSILCCIVQVHDAFNVDGAHQMADLVPFQGRALEWVQGCQKHSLIADEHRSLMYINSAWYQLAVILEY